MQSVIQYLSDDEVSNFLIEAKYPKKLLFQIYQNLIALLNYFYYSYLIKKVLFQHKTVLLKLSCYRFLFSKL